MLVLSGFFKADSPAIKLRIAGAQRKHAVEFDAIVDTGFTGFISMPLLRAFPLGLILRATTEVELADGSKQTKLVAEGRAFVGDRVKKGLVILEDESRDVLIGMDFLRTFRLMLNISKNSITLVDESHIAKLTTRVLREQKKRAAEAARKKP